MFAWLIGIIVPKLADDAVAAIFNLLAGEVQKRNLVAHGAQQQAAKESNASAQTQQTVAQAISDAPHSRAEVLKVLDGGKF